MPSTIADDELVERLADDTIVLLDAQAPGWFERKHLPGAHRINWDDIVGSVRDALPDPRRHRLPSTAGTPAAPAPRSPPPSWHGSATATSTDTSVAAV